MKLKARDGKLYAEIGLRDVLDRCDLSDTPILAEFRRLYDENDKLRELVLLMHRYIAESCAVQYPYPPEPVSYLSLLETERRMRELGIEVDG